MLEREVSTLKGKVRGKLHRKDLHCQHRNLLLSRHYNFLGHDDGAAIDPTANPSLG